MPASASAACRRFEFAHAYSLPRTPRRWRTSSTRGTSAARNAARNDSPEKPYTPIVATRRTFLSSHGAHLLRDPAAVPRMARGAPRVREGAARRLLQEGLGAAQHHLAAVGRRGALLRLDRRDPARHRRREL